MTALRDRLALGALDYPVPALRHHQCTAGDIPAGRSRLERRRRSAAGVRTRCGGLLAARLPLAEGGAVDERRAPPRPPLRPRLHGHRATRRPGGGRGAGPRGDGRQHGRSLWRAPHRRLHALEPVAHPALRAPRIGAPAGARPPARAAPVAGPAPGRQRGRRRSRSIFEPSAPIGGLCSAPGRRRVRARSRFAGHAPGAGRRRLRGHQAVLAVPWDLRRGKPFRAQRDADRARGPVRLPGAGSRHRPPRWPA